MDMKRCEEKGGARERKNRKLEIQWERRLWTFSVMRKLLISVRFLVDFISLVLLTRFDA